jgi:uncharacterized protein (DUF486 family)
MNGLYTVGLLVLSNTFMPFAWYWHLNFNESLRQNHFSGFAFLILAVYFIFKK